MLGLTGLEIIGRLVAGSRNGAPKEELIRICDRATRRRIRDQRSAMTVGSKIECAVEIIERQARAVSPIGDCEHAARCIVGLFEPGRVVIDSDKIDYIRMSGIGCGPNEAGNVSSEPCGLIEHKRAGPTGKSHGLARR